MNHTEKLVDAMLHGTKEQTQAAFHQAMGAKVEAALNVARVALTAEIYNNNASTQAPAAK